MRAAQLERPGKGLRLVEMPEPEPRRGEILVRVRACGVCRTDLHIVDGEITAGSYPIVPGHQIVGEVVQARSADLAAGQRVGIPWLGYTCGVCDFCSRSSENLCDAAEFTGYQRQGGYAEYVVADARFCFPLPHEYPDLQAAPLLCAGMIGYRSLRMTGDARRVGFYGFGNAAHILTQIACWEGREVFAVTRPQDSAGQRFARTLGAVWAGGTEDDIPDQLDAAVIFAPVGELVPKALRRVRKGGVVVCAGIHMSDIPSFPYSDLWGERVIKSVANLTRADGRRLLEIAPRVPVRTRVRAFPLARTAEALAALRQGRIDGAAVVTLAT